MFTLLCAISRSLSEISHCCPINSDATCDGKSDYRADGYRQFIVKGIYSDDSDEELTTEVTWTTDSSGDNVLSTVTDGLLYCYKASGVFSISAR